MILWTLLGFIIYRLIWSKLWLNTSLDQLIESEREMVKIFSDEKANGFTVESKTVAGLGTLIVSAASTTTTHEDGADSHIKKTLHPNKKENIVLIHGYAGANGYWAPCFESLFPRFNIFCVEMRGWGRSDRVPPKEKTADEVLAFFASTMEAWRIEMGLETFVLCGHSLGAHCAASYATRHPHNVSHLILASPPGIALPPKYTWDKLSPSTWEAFKENNNGPAISAAGDVFHRDRDDEEAVIANPENDNLPSSPSPSTKIEKVQGSPFLRLLRDFYPVLSFVISSNFTPGDVVRWLGPFGHSYVWNTIALRLSRCKAGSFFHAVTPSQLKAMADYTFHNFALPPSGERTLGVIFFVTKEGVHVRKPLIAWLRGKKLRRTSICSNSPPQETSPLLNAGGGSEIPRIHCPVSIIFGSRKNDWTNDGCCGFQLTQQLEREGIQGRVYEMKESGHLVYLEDPLEFCDLLIKAVDGHDVGSESNASE